MRVSPRSLSLRALRLAQDELTIPVLKQRSTLEKGSLPLALANTPCAELGSYRVLEELK